MNERMLPIQLTDESSLFPLQGHALPAARVSRRQLPAPTCAVRALPPALSAHDAAYLVRLWPRRLVHAPGRQGASDRLVDPESIKATGTWKVSVFFTRVSSPSPIPTFPDPTRLGPGLRIFFFGTWKIFSKKLGVGRSGNVGRTPLRHACLTRVPGHACPTTFPVSPPDLA
jgi:hypothetical protein